MARAYHGTANQAIEWMFDVSDDRDLGNQEAFLRAWREGNAEDEWPEFYEWLGEQDATNEFTDPLSKLAGVAGSLGCDNHHNIDDKTLVIEAKRDNFSTETPIRGFTEWKVTGTVAIGKGFRPSMTHLSAYLDALLNKHGWRMAAIIYPDRTSQQVLAWLKICFPENEAIKAIEMPDLKPTVIFYQEVK